MKTPVDISIFIHYIATSYIELTNLRTIPKSFFKFDVKNEWLPNLTVQIYRDGQGKLTYHKNNKPIEVMLEGFSIHVIESRINELKEELRSNDVV